MTSRKTRNVSGKNWVPGFIWITPRLSKFERGPSKNYEWRFETKPPMLIRISQITDLIEIEPWPDKQDPARTIVGTTGEASFEVIETPDQIADLIRNNWEKTTTFR